MRNGQMLHKYAKGQGRKEGCYAEEYLLNCALCCQWSGYNWMITKRCCYCCYWQWSEFPHMAREQVHSILAEVLH